MEATTGLKRPGGTLEDPLETPRKREREITLLAAVGHTSREIATALHVSEQTSHNYRSCVMEKLGPHRPPSTC